MDSQIKFYIKFLCLFSTFFIKSHAFPNGAPLGRCGSMIPGHKADPLTNSPFYLDVVKNNDAYFVTLKSDSSDLEFKGFLIEARKDKDSADSTFGEWETNDDHAKTIDCFDKPRSAVTHTSKKKSGQLTFKWSPKTTDATQVTFVATVVKSYSKFYVGITKQMNLI